MNIRGAVETDAEQICCVHRASIRQLCSVSYEPDLIEEWISFLMPERYLEAINTLDFVVAEVDGRVQGFYVLDIRAGELDAIHLAPPAAGRGLGRAFMARAEATARPHGLTELFVKATLNAVSFYERCGFRIERHSNLSAAVRDGACVR